MKVYFTLTKSRLLLILAVMLLVIGISYRFYCVNIIPLNGDTNAHRVDFIKGIGVSAKEEFSESKEIVIPAEFSDVYSAYNELQKSSGYDLLPYVGCKAVCYTYTLLNEDGSESNEDIHLLVYNGRVIGGDISSRELDGSMKPLPNNER